MAEKNWPSLAVHTAAMVFSDLGGALVLEAELRGIVDVPTMKVWEFWSLIVWELSMMVSWPGSRV